jgi:hypothetical protein
LRVSAFGFLIMGAFVCFADALIRLWATALFFQIITRRLSLYVLRLLRNVGLIRNVISRHEKFLLRVRKPGFDLLAHSEALKLLERRLAALPAGFTSTRLAATFTCSTAAGFSSAALLIASAAGMCFSASAAATTVTRLLFLFFGRHGVCPFAFGKYSSSFFQFDSPSGDKNRGWGVIHQC